MSNENIAEGCTSNCSTCGANCASRNKPQSLILEPHKKAKVKKVIGVVSGKGGVGKSMVTSLLAVQMQRQGKRSAILDADITGPSIPKAFGVTGHVNGNEEDVFPACTRTGIQLMSTNLLLDKPTDPVVWRGPVIAGMVKQFWTEVVWDNVDFMFVDMPPGTGDVPLTVYQSIPLDGIIIVTSPQNLVSMIVEKAVNMAAMMNVPILGFVENMSYFECPDCGKKHSVFGASHIEELAAEYGVANVVRMPIRPELASLVDAGKVEECVCGEFDSLLQHILKL